MKNHEIADIFAEMADLMEILGEDRFRINAYRTTARVIGELSEDVAKLAAEGKLMDLPGIGKSTAEKIQQYLATGKIERHEELVAKVPASVALVMKVPGLGPKTALALWEEAGITTVEQLKEVLDKDPQRILDIPRMGMKKLIALGDALAFMESTGSRIRLGDAERIADELLEAVRKLPGVERAVAAGSLRRGKETVGDIDLLCVAAADRAAEIIRQFTTAAQVRRVLAAGETKGSVVLGSGVQADLRVVEAGSFGAAMAYFTGSKAHNVRQREIAMKLGLKLNEYGLYKGERQVAGADEEGIYRALHLAYVPPELRENAGEIEAAAEGKLPELVELADIAGDFHMHTTASDGANSIEEMIAACAARGYHTIAICDHSKGQPQAGGMDEQAILAHAEKTRHAAKKFPAMHVLAGAEVDILKDGTLDYPADVLAGLDFVCASPHKGLTMGRADATERLIRAIRTPGVHCIGHPSGRLINARAGMELDIEAIAAAAAECDVALEINANYHRLDLRDVHVRAAVNAGAKIIISTDAHSTDELGMMHYGVTTARRGWAIKADVINTWPAAKLHKWLKSRQGI